MSRPEFKGFDADLAAIMDGKAPVPNFEEITDLGKALALWSSAGGSSAPPDQKLAKLPGSARMYGDWARYLLHRTQGGDYDGTGYVMTYNGGKGRMGRFAICKHEKVAGPGANPSRGWHPGYCSICGMDLTVDSGD